MIFTRIRRAHLVRARCAHAVWAPQPHGVKGGVVPLVYKCRNLWQANSAHATNRIREIIAHHIWRQAHNLEYLRALITLQGRYAHFRRHLHNTLQNSVVVCAYGHISIAVKGAIPHKRANALVRQIRAHGTRAIAQKRGEVVHGNRFCAFQHHRYSGALFCAHKILFHGRHRQKRRNWHMVFVYPAVCEHNYVCARVVCFFDYQEQTFQRHIQRCVFVIKQADRLRLQLRRVQRLDFFQLNLRENWRIHLQKPAVFGSIFQQVAITSHINRGVYNYLFAHGIYGRIGNLRKHLLEVIEQRAVLRV